jgi:uncharacterized SAM-binding protein YcdF (DUF218 family)
MSFILSKVLWLVVAPGNLLALLALGGIGLQLAGGPRWRRRGLVLSGTVAGLMAVLLVLPVDAWLLEPLERRFPQPAAMPEKVDGIIVLGGMVDTSATAAWGRPTLNHGADRLTDFVYLARRWPAARLVFSGGSGALVNTQQTEAPVAREILGRLGLDLGRVVFEGASRNTYENVRFSQEALKPQPGETWLLITSATHMPRAVGIFRRAGWPVVAWPVAYRTGLDAGQPPSLDLAATLLRFDEAVHEWVGLLSYRLLDRTDAWFPGPK